MERVKNSQDIPETENRRIYCPIYQDGGPRYGACMVAQMLKNLSAMQETRVQPLGHEDTLEKGMATHSSTLVWGIPWRGAWRAAVHWVAKNQTQLID